MDGSYVLTTIGELLSAGMTDHAWMYEERQFSDVPCPACELPETCDSPMNSCFADSSPSQSHIKVVDTEQFISSIQEQLEYLRGLKPDGHLTRKPTQHQ